MDISRLVEVKPDERQIAWQSLGFTAFLHFGMNTFTNREWGDGQEDPACFRPAALDTDQWCEALRAAGVRACILTAKHHDGFCLWDTAHTRHSAMYAPQPVDVVASLSASCEKFNLKLGLYLSPWDRHEPRYGTGKSYDDYFCAQLEEITSHYGELYCVWFDGACGEGPEGKRQVYDWERYYAIVRRNQPHAAISIIGPDVRWIGNEAGETRPSEWSVVPVRLRDAHIIAAKSQQGDDTDFRERGLSPEDVDLGSRRALENEGELCWYPAEVDVSIRPGWFYHPEDDGKARSLENLLDIYEASAGGNAVLLLNVPPDTRGLIHEADVARLRELGDALRAIYSVNILAAPGAAAHAHDGSGRPAPEIPAPEVPAPEILVDDDSFWHGEGERGAITVTLPRAVTISRAVLCEQIRESQRIEAFTLSARDGVAWREIYRGTTVGFRKICRFPPVTADAVRVTVTESRLYPTLRFVGLY